MKKANKTVLITGSNKGIGFEIARQCGRQGFRVILSGRDEIRLQAAVKILTGEHIDVDSVVMDVGNEGSVRRAAQQLSDKGIRIHVLVNNAGILFHADQGLLQNDSDILYQTINTNSYGPLRVTRAFLTCLEVRGRIIMMSSSGGIMSGEVPGWSPAYCASKTLLNAITRHLANELKGKHISVNAVSPGWVRTDMGGQGATRSVEKGAETAVWLASKAPQELTGQFFMDKTTMAW